MIKGNIVKLHDEDLAEISGGENKFWDNFSGEAGKQAFLCIAAPIVVGVGVFVEWFCKKITKKYDKDLDKALGITEK